MERAPVVVEVQGLVQQFGNRRVLDDISFTLHRGEILGLLGPSGSGKTTLVKAIAAIGTYTGGEVTVLGERMPSLAKIGRIGYMAQADALYQDLSGLDNLHFFGELYGVPKKRRIERIAQLLELTQLQEAAKRKVETYSGGMKRRLSLAVALLHEPEILILDEPTVGIDPVLRRDSWREFLRLQAEGVSIIITTHAMDEAEHCNSLGLVREGRLMALDTPDALKQKTGTTTIEEAFLHLGGVTV